MAATMDPEDTKASEDETKRELDLGDEEKDSREKGQAGDKETLSASQSIERLRTIRSERSHPTAEGYTYFSDDEEVSTNQNAQNQGEKEFEVKFEGDNDPYNPKCRGYWHKWLIVLIIASSSTCVTCVSSMYTITYTQLQPELNSSREVATLGLSLFVGGLGLGPMILAPLSEFYGRRPIYIYSLVMFVIWLIPCAVAENMATMLVARFLSGFSGAAFLSVAGGTVGDMFAVRELSAPMMVYTASPFIGPELGPLVGGFIVQYTDWRWVFYVLIIWSVVQVALIIALVPETYIPVTLRQKAIALRKETGNEAWKAPIEKQNKSIPRTIMWSCIRPFQLLFLEPMCLNLCILTAILLGIIYLFFGSFALIFEDVYGFEIYQIGLAFVGLLIGMIIGVACDPLWKRYYNKLVENNDGVSEPEYRLPPTVAGAWLVPIGLFGFAWTTYDFVHWIVPIIFSGIFGLGTIWVFGGVFSNLVQSYPLYAASALAANSFARSSFAAAFPLFGIQMYQTLGYQWASSLLAFLALVMAPFPFIFFRYGKSIRKRSRYASA